MPASKNGGERSSTPGSGGGSEGGVRRSSRPSAAGVSSAPSFEIDTGDLETLPQRYAIRQGEEARYLVCVEAPTVGVRVDKGVTVPASAARKYPTGTIFLDGAAAGEPFTDDKRGVYNLDHHEGCVRAFTLATCEQAMVLVRKGLDLSRGDWTVYANEPDLDTVLAIWVLLNHMRLAGDDETVRRAIMPLVRLEGAIDAHGLHGKDLLGFPDGLLARANEQMEAVRKEEVELKGAGLWSSTDYLEYTARALRAVDELVYTPRDFKDFQHVEELARVDIGSDRIAVLCRSDSGIYEVEQALRRLHGGRVGLVVLQKDPKAYTLRLTDSFLPVKLDALYERLNLVDPAVAGGAARSRWGGSAEIGGSPRAGGTALSVQGIARTVRWVYQPPSPVERARSVAVGASLFLGYLALAALLSWAAGGLTAGGLAGAAAATHVGWVGAVLAALAVGSLGVLGLRDRRRFGLRWPAGPGFLALLPVAVLAGAAGGAAATPPGRGLLVPALLLPLAVEAVARGAVHGLLFAEFRVQRAGGPWFVSVPMAVTALLSTLATALVLAGAAAGGVVGGWAVPTGIAAAAVLGLCCGLVRERGESLLPPVVLHLAAGVAAASLPSLLG